MNTKNIIAILLIAATCMLSLSCEPGYDRDRDRYDKMEAERSLMGNWYVNGDPDKRAKIVLTAGGLEARNEKGETSRLSVMETFGRSTGKAGFRATLVAIELTGRIVLIGHASRFALA